MSNDTDGSTGVPIVSSYRPIPRDLETIVVLLELAAIDLTPLPGAVFTADQLLERAREWAGEDFELLDVDVRIVLNYQKFLKRLPGKKFCLR